MRNVRENFKRRLRQALTHVRTVVGKGNDYVFLRPRHSDGTWEGIKGRNPFVVCRKDFAGDGAPEEVVKDLNAPLGANPIPVTSASLEQKPT